MQPRVQPGVPLASFTLGPGDAGVVLLHGFMGSGKNLRTLAQRCLARQPGWRFLLPDLTGHGESPPLAAGADLDVLAADVLATATAAGWTGPLTIVGHSLGGRVALAAARREPGRVAAAVLLDISPRPIDPAVSESRRVLDVLLRAPAEVADRRQMRDFLVGQGLSPALSDWLLMNLRPDNDRYVWRIDRAALDALHATTTRDDLWAVVEGGATPVRCIRGGRSSYVSDQDVARLQAAGCRVDTLPEAGHYVHLDALDALVDLLV